ncbi:MAG TPA: lytic transglycosylase domain-containing protein [Anaerolineales bacterium]|nr:lytic transglycosylase domain-containing protein [Anaerolineales bacterium]
MGSSPNQKNRTKATSTQPRGGCFSAVSTPLVVIALIGFIIQMLNGETTRPWDLVVEAKPVENGISITIEDASADAPSNPSGRLASFFAPSVLYWEQDIMRWAEEWNLDPNLVATIMQIESCGDPSALSHAGAMGLFQVMPYHFSAGDSPYAPNTNAKRGMAYLSKALATYNNDVRLGLASYNGGIGTAAKAEGYWPNETQRYVYWGTGIYNQAVKGKQNSSRLNEWLGAGGASLCRQAEERLGISP